jgi:large subunit ribosomal protein L35
MKARPAQAMPRRPFYFSLKGIEMAKSKLKTKTGVKKRFKITATGKVLHPVAGKRHRLISHNSKYIRQNRGTEVLCDADARHVKMWAPYGIK